MSLDALVALRAKIDHIIATNVTKQSAELRRKIAELSLHVDGAGPAKSAKKLVGGRKKRAKAAIKYRGPKGEKWSGRGQTPLWMRPLLKKGKKKEDFLVS